MNIKSFEQINVSEKIVGEKSKMLSENLEVIIKFLMRDPYLLNYQIRLILML